MITLLALLANIMLSWAFFRGPAVKYCDPLGVVLVLLALVVALAASTVSWPSAIERAAARLGGRFLVVLVVIQFVAFAPVLMKVASDGGYPTHLAWLLLLAGIASAASYRWEFLLRPRARLPILLAVAMAPAFWMIRSQPKPLIDVLMFEEEGSRVLISGRNPYAWSYRNVYKDDHFYGQGVVKNGLISCYPYPPLSVFAVLPGYLLGDVRYASLAALAGTCLLLLATGRRLGVPPGAARELIIVALVLQVANLSIIRFGWTEPFLTLGAVACGYSLAAGRGCMLGLSLAWVVGIKQYGFLWAIPVLATGRVSRKGLLIGSLAILAPALPFVIWGPREFWISNVVMRLRLPFRSDLLTVPALVYSSGGHKLSAAWALVATGLVSFLVLSRRPLDPARAVLGGTAIFLAAVVFSHHGPPNFYWFGSVSSLLAAVLDSRKISSDQDGSWPSRQASHPGTRARMSPGAPPG